MRNFLKHTWALACVAAAVSGANPGDCQAQSGAKYQSVATAPAANGETLIDATVDSIELVTGSSRRLKFEYKIPE